MEAVKLPYTRNKKIAIAVLGLVGLLFVIGVATGNGDSDSSSSSASSSASSSGSEASGGGADIRVVPAGSSCLEDPYNAKIIFTVHLRNSGSEDGTAEVTPVRRYSDSSRNDSIMDMLSVDVPAYGDRTVWHSYDYNAEAHSLLECWAQIDGKNTPIAVG
jgi:hypothetical protein